MVDHSTEQSLAHLLEGQLCLGLSTMNVQGVSGSGEREEQRLVEEVIGDCVDCGTTWQSWSEAARRYIEEVPAVKLRCQ